MLVLIFASLVVSLGVMAAHVRGEGARTLLESAARRLPDERQEWGRAMLAELESIEGRLARTRFALGCTRVALLPPTKPGSSSRSRNTTIAVGSCALMLAAYTRFRLLGTSYPDSTQHHAPYEVTIWMIVLAIAVSYGTIAVVRLQTTNSRAIASRRYGAVGGVLSGLLVLVACSPILMRASDSDPLSLTPNGWVFLAALVAPLVLAITAVRSTGEMRAGVDTGWWSGVIAGAIVVVGLLAFTYVATHWFVHSPATITAYHTYWPPRGTHQTHFRNITAFLINANLGTAAIIGVLALPVLSYGAGTIGALVGVALPERRRRSQSRDDGQIIP